MATLSVGLNFTTYRRQGHLQQRSRKDCKERKDDIHERNVEKIGYEQKI
jgi:hypothetical protein